MAVTFTPFNSFMKYLLQGTIDLQDDAIKLALVTSAYTPDVTDDIWGDISANEVATGDGYTTGGEALGSKTFAVSDVSGAGTFDSADVVWSSLTKTFRYGVLYAEVTRDTIVNPLIGYILFDDSPADIVVSGVDFTVYWHANGILTLDLAA